MLLQLGHFQDTQTHPHKTRYPHSNLKTCKDDSKQNNGDLQQAQAALQAYFNGTYRHSRHRGI